MDARKGPALQGLFSSQHCSAWPVGKGWMCTGNQEVALPCPERDLVRRVKP
jgi:hypothetical protein